MEVTNIKDMGIKHATLNAGRFVIDGEGVLLTKTTQVAFRDTIHRITESKVISHYENAQGVKMSVEDYESSMKPLTGSGTYDGYTWHFEDIDDEYTYKKFVHTWCPIYRIVEETSEVIPTISADILLNSGNDFIIPMFTVGSSATELYELRRSEAQWNSLHKVFKSLGFEYHTDTHYQETAQKKIYGGKDLRFITAFGTYIFGDWIKKSPVYRAKLEDCIRVYNSDKEEIVNRVQDLYKKHCAAFDSSGLNYKLILTNLELAYNKLCEIDEKKSSAQLKGSVKSLLMETKKLVSVGFSTEETNT